MGATWAEAGDEICANGFVESVVAADVFAGGLEAAVGGEDGGGVETSGLAEGGLLVVHLRGQLVYPFCGYAGVVLDLERFGDL